MHQYHCRVARLGMEEAAGRTLVDAQELFSAESPEKRPNVGSFASSVLMLDQQPL